MTSTTSKLDWAFIAMKSAVLIYGVVLMVAGCNPPQSQPVVKNRVPTIIPAEVPPPPPPAPAAAPEPEKKDDSPYYGSTYWDELLTSVYYYPDAGDQLEGPPSFRGSKPLPATHLKFNHREDDVWLCGDQRKSFEPGNRYRLLVTFELGQPCITNWKIK